MEKAHSLYKRHIIISLATFIIGTFFGIMTLQAAQVLPFSSQLTWMFPGIEQNYSSIAFQYWGNNFAGMIFWTTGVTLSTPETISISWGSQSIMCLQKINGIYYSNQRGRRLRPLDTGSLQTLRSWDASYNTLQITGWLYTNCTWVSWYLPNTNEVYGQIIHTRSGTQFHLIAGLNYNFTLNSITWTSFWGTLYWINNIASWHIYDSYGWIGYVWGTGQGTMLIGVWICGLAGNMTIVTVPWLITQASLYTPNYYYASATWNVNFQTWAIMPSTYSISSAWIVSTVTWNYTTGYNPPYVTTINTWTFNLNINSGQAQITTIFSTWWIWMRTWCNYTVTNRITIDMLPPSAPTSMSPTSWNGICYVGSHTFSWSWAVDSGVWITQYNYKIYSGTNLTTPIINASTGWTSVNISASQLGTWYFSGSYYRSVQAIDGLGHTWAMLTGRFVVWLDYCPNSGYIIIYGTIPRLRNAELNREYLSDPFTVNGLPGPIIASVATWILYVNGTGTSNQWYINNGDELNIKLRSSTLYDTTISTRFSIGSRSATFYITTKSLVTGTVLTWTITGTVLTWTTTWCVLATGERLIIQNIFDMMRETYDANQGTLSSFLFTMQSMLQDDIALTNSCSLDYLLNTVDSYIMNNVSESLDESNHTAPNCKVYSVTYNSQKSWYTSTDFRKKVYFASRDALTRYIDSKNPWDCQVNTYEDLPDFDSSIQSWYHTAPNGKIYQIKDKTLSWTTVYYSPDFLKVKNFENQDDLLTFIDSNNPIYDVRNHEVDVDFEPVFFTTPNNKEYKIYKTDQWFMSYKLMKVQYFETLDEIETYIYNNNKR